jgi:hypothetical protein
MRRTALLVCLLVLAPTVAHAQTTVTSQSGVAFIASADHATVVAGVPIVDHYDLTVVAQSPTTATGFTFGLAKPTPDATGLITVKPIANFGALTNGQYTAFVAAVGPGGATNSPSSDPFVRVSGPGSPGKPAVVK